jgi:hypothetical protein
MTFSTALSLLREGEFVARKCWADGDYVYLLPELSVPIKIGHHTYPAEMIRTCKESGCTYYYHPPHEDLLTDDWEVYHD